MKIKKLLFAVVVVAIFCIVSNMSFMDAIA